jgi:Fe-S-cluster containining protein
MSECFFAKGLSFSCKQCSHCCRHEPGFVYLSKNDLTNITQSFNLNISEFIHKYCRWVNYYDGTQVLCLKEKDNYDCIFWDNGCLVYSGRPVQCRTYPFWSFLLESKKSWDDEAKECPGINSGAMHNFEDIMSAKNEYANNIPLKKNELKSILGEADC